MIVSFSSIYLLGSVSHALDQPLIPGKLVMWLLMMMSIVSWVTIIMKMIQLRRLKGEAKRFSNRLRQSKTTLEMFELGWNEETCPQYQIYHAGAREAAYQLLGSREPHEGMNRKVRKAGKLTAQQLGSLRIAFASGYREAESTLEQGLPILKTLSKAAFLLGGLGFTWVLMRGFDTARDFTEVAPEAGAAIAYLAVAFAVAVPASIGALVFELIVKRRTRVLAKFRDDINRLFERSFGSRTSAPAASRNPSNLVRKDEDDAEPEEKEAPLEEEETEGKKQFHSIRERLIRGESSGDDKMGELHMNPIAQQAATVRAR